MITQKFYPTIVLSDIHLGTEHSKTTELTNFLRTVNCNTLILNGDIIDGWNLQKSGKGKWKHEHTEFFKVIMKMMEKHNTQIIYIRGNHDDFIDLLAPFSFANLSIVKDYVHESNGKRYYVVHGDVFDSVTSKMRWLAKIGDVGYTFLLWGNRIYNKYRAKRGLPYFSLSQSVKQMVKSAVSYISDYEKELVSLAKSRHFDGIICGHIHKPANEMIDGIHYLNSGDWVESMSALLENEDGTWEVYLESQEAQEYDIKRIPLNVAAVI
ncbi:UDP-2,3-diacylglucosamine diphosphatase [Parabacteroides sp. FAFU027]|uniref:UDP-2,3-diacylglucosamine diphosphatase n=1 Tax=Parabacteroides sp. FAFU027 TaxID=2922715 RepID=UPI001FAEF0ED|nr:UDP-2,3-diacylglucosamine diphosphatase [Parabacteroides sp. FAFU027]